MPDVVVVGGGVVGLCCALSLRRRGCDVLVLDRGEPGAGASAGNAGWIVPSFSGPVPTPAVRTSALAWLLNPRSPLVIRPRAERRFIRWLRRFWRACSPHRYEHGLAATARLNARTMALFDGLRADGVEFETAERGVLFLHRSEAAARAEFATLERVARHGFARPIWLGSQELRAEEPAAGDGVAAGVLAPAERHVRPESLTRGLRRVLADRAVEVRAGVEVTGFRRERGRVNAVVTSAGDVAAASVLLAAGAWTGELAGWLGVDLPLEGGKGYSITLAPPPVALRRPTYLAEAHVACTPFEGALRLGGTMELSGLNLRLDRRRVDALQDAAAAYLRGWTPVPSAGWAGLRPMTPDGLPAIGRLPGYGNAYAATGHAMLGVTLAPATAEAVADLIVGRPDRSLLAPFDPARFG